MRVILAIYVLLDIIISLAPASGISVGHWDKVSHFLVYAGMAVLSMLSFESKRARTAALVGAVGLGGLLEWAQSFVPGRQMSLADAIVNALGVISGALLFHLRHGGRH
jgi:VanZ family protein